MGDAAALRDRPATRGRGRLENYLSARRAAMARRRLDPALRGGRVLDYGCGSFPHFLVGCGFAERYGVDQVAAPDPPVPGVRYTRLDIERADRLPFADGFFDAVTMLAVFEHIPEPDLVRLLDEVDRVLAPGGQFFMTTPAGWTAPIIAVLAGLGLISPEEASEHEAAYSHRMIRGVLGRTGLGVYPARRGSFECGMNNWVSVRKPGLA